MQKSDSKTYRQDTNKKRDEVKFSRTARKVHKKNIAPIPMRGGIRL